MVMPVNHYRRSSLKRRILENWELYVLLLPAIIVILVFKYYPLYGVQLAFKNMKLGQTIESAKWEGLQNFKRFFNTGMFERTVLNTLIIGIMVVMTFPIPIFLALMLHNCVNKGIRKITQTVTYIPNLVSIAVTMSIVLLFCGESSGFINIFRKSLGLPNIYFMGEAKYVRPLYLISEIWSKTGYNSVVYLAALSAVSLDLIDASMIDGCSKIQRIWYVDIPTITPTIVVLLIMNIGTFFNASTDKMLLLQTDLNLSASETIGTYTYKLGFTQRQYGYSAAVDLFTNAVNLAMLILANTISRKISDSSLF